MTSTLATVFVAGVVALTGCSGSDEGSASSPPAAPTSAAAAETSPPPGTTPSTDMPPASDTADGPGSTIAVVPDTGVPGIDSGDPFCNAWSRFAGSFQALAFASNFAEPDDAIRLEVAASDAVLVAVVDLDGAFPAEVETEREMFLDGLLGPFAARSALARQSMLDAGLTPAQVTAIGETWLDAVAESGIGDPRLAVEIPVESAESFDRAVVVFGSNVPAVAADPSLVTDASAPLTESYIADTCPDQGILGGNDIVVD